MALQLKARAPSVLRVSTSPVVRTAVFLATLVLAAATVAPADWRQWRGPDGLGVAPEGRALPQTWSYGGRDSSQNIEWRTEIPGEGNSSPVVAGGRVFVTTAYEGRQGGLLKSVLLGTAFFLALAFSFRALREGVLGSFGRRPVRLGGLLLLGGSLVFVIVALAAILRPELLFPIGKPGRIWRVSGALALLGMAAAFAWFEGGSRWRPFGAAVLLLSAGLVIGFAPSGYKGPLPIAERAALVLHALAATCWFLIDFARSRRRVPASGSFATSSRPWLAAPLVVLSVLVFVPPNLLNRLQRAVICLDLDSGEILWQKAVFSASPEKKWPRGTYATPTPVADGEQVYVYFGVGLAGLDFDGNIRWKQRFPAYSQHTRYGAAVSPLLTDDSVLVVQESEMYQGAPPSWIAAFDKESGKVRWRITPEDSHDSYNTPLLLQSGPTTQLLTATWHLLAAYDAQSGERLWTLDHPQEETVSSMARADDLIALTGGTRGPKNLIVMQWKGDAAETVWESRKSVASISSPVFYRGMLFTITDAGIMVGYEAESGAMLWRKRLDGEYFASLLAGDGKVYAINTEGTTTVVAAEPEFRSISVNELDGGVYASPAVSEKCLLVRTESALYCIENPGSTGY